MVRGGDFLKLANTIAVVYYRIEGVEAGRIEEAFPSALEFRDPTEESLSVVSSPEEPGEGFLVIDLLYGGDRYVFIAGIKGKFALINDLRPSIFVVPVKRLPAFFRALAENRLKKVVNETKKGKKWLLIFEILTPFGVTFIVGLMHLGIWAWTLISVMILTIFRSGRRKRGIIRLSRSGIIELNEKSVEKMLKSLEKRERLERVIL